MKELSVLIVEDKLIATQYLSDILHCLKSFNIQTIHTATNSQEAQKIVQNHAVDIVFMDINLEGAEDGIMCAKNINASHSVPVIYTTAYKDSQTMQEASESNIYGFLTKPFKPSDVEAALVVSFKMIQLQIPQEKKAEAKSSITLKNYTYDAKSKLLLKEKSIISLTHKELELIETFFNNINQILSYDTLREKVWKKSAVSDSTIRDAISRLKRKTVGLELENMSKLGYILKA